MAMFGRRMADIRDRELNVILSRLFPDRLAVAAPLAPAPDVQRRPVQAGLVEGQEGVAGRDAGAAVDDEALGRDVAEELLVHGAELRGGLADVVGVREVDGAGDVPGDRVDGLGLAAEALARADVEDAPG